MNSPVNLFSRIRHCTLRQQALATLGAIALAQSLIMLALEHVLPATAPLWQFIAVNAAVLVLASVPIIWFLLLGPMRAAAAQAKLEAQVIMDTAGEGIITTDADGIVLTFNRAAERIFGYRAEEIVGQSVGRLMPPAYREAHAHYMRAYLEGRGAGVMGRKRLMTGQRANGETFPLEIAVTDVRIGNRIVFTSVVHDVSAYKATEAVLAKTNALLERILSGMNSPVAYLDRDFNFIRVNRAYAQADQKTPDFFVGKNHFALYPNAENEAIFRRVVETGEPYRARAKAFQYPDHPEGGTTYWDWTLEPEKDEEGRVQNLLLLLYDVTASVLAEQERTRALARFRTLFEASGDAIFIHDLRGRFLEVNQSACERLGYTHEELLQMGPRQIDTPEYAACVDARMAEVRAHGAAVFESAHVRRDGSVIPVEISSRLIDYDGQPAILSTARDLTMRRRMEAAVQESEQNARALLDAINESALLLAADGTILAINETGARRLGQAPQAMIGRNLLDLLPADVAESRRRHLETVLATGQAVRFQDSRAGRLYDTSLNPIRDGRGRIRRIAAYAQDITETRRLQAIEELLRGVDEQILQGAPLEQLATFICDQVVRLFDLQLAWIGEKKPDGSVALIAGAGPATDYQQELMRIGVRWDDSPTGRGTTGAAIRLGKPQVVDIAKSISFAPWREAAETHGFAAVCAIPLVIRGEIYGAFTLYSSLVDGFTDAQLLQTLNNIAARVSVALEASLDHEQLRLLGAALSTASNAVFITDRAGVIQWVNDAFLSLSGYTRREIIGNTPRLLKSGVHDQDYYRRLWDTILAGQPFSSETTERRKDGSLYTVRQTITPVRARDGPDFTAHHLGGRHHPRARAGWPQ